VAGVVTDHGPWQYGYTKYLCTGIEALRGNPDFHAMKIISIFFLASLCISSWAQEVIFRDDFVDNRNNWYTSFSAGTCGVANDRYFINKTTETGNFFFYKSLYLETGKEFVVETSVRQVSGVDNHGYGLIWGSNELKDAYVFIITSNGYFNIFKYVNSKYEDYKAWTKIEGIKPMGTDNLIRIHHRLDSTLFMLNNKQIFAAPSLKPKGFYTGFVVNNNMHIEADYLELKQNQAPLKTIENFQPGLVKENLGANVNGAMGEVAPVISADGKTLYFDRKMTADPWDDIYYSNLQADNQWGPAIEAGKPLNNSGYNFVISVTPDGNSLLLGNTYNADGTAGPSGLSVSQRTEKGWSLPTTLKIDNFYNRSGYNEFALSPDGKTLLLCIERDDTWGAKDVYVSFLKADASWTEPKNLGPLVNTLSGEASPFIAADGVTMYYSTDGKKGYGSNDIYITRRLDDTWLNWSEPLNLGTSVNSAEWEAYYTVPAKGDFAYLVSFGVDGSTDIFKLKLAESAKPKPVVLVSGQVFDAKTKKTLRADISYESLSTGQELGIARTDPSDGSYKIALVTGDEYGFLANATGYYPVSENLNLKELKAYQEIKRDLYLVPLEVNQAIRLNNLFFDFAKADLKTQSFSELNRLADFMKVHPGMTIELGGHTDNVGDDQSNLKLSEERTRSVRSFLIQKGVDEKRLLSKGYGETKPVADNKTEEGKQLNRRVEFLIISQ
jgi:outer membrane protein OmpA-like peptidoglycan-associated protein